jgi:hypothetical protein
MHSITDTSSLSESSILTSQEHHYAKTYYHKENTGQIVNGILMRWT